MPSLPIISASSFAPAQDIAYKEPWINSKGMKNVGINSAKHGQQLHLSVPLMLTWGVNVKEHEPGKITYDMSLQFPRPGEETDSSQSFLRALQDMESKLIEDATANSVKWFNQPALSAEVAQDRLNRMLYVPRDIATGLPKPDKSPSLRVKLDCWDGVFKSEIYDASQNPLYPGGSDTPVELITKGSQVACLIKCGGIYFSNGKFGVTWRLVQAVVQPRATMMGHCHITLAPAEIEAMEQSSKPNRTYDDDDEDDLVGIQQIAADIAAHLPTVEPDEGAAAAAAEAAEAAEPVKPKKKRVVRRRKAAADAP